MGVIAPYSAQVKLLKVSLLLLSVLLPPTSYCPSSYPLPQALLAPYPSIEVGTVDQFQGRDKEAVLYSCTRSNQGGEEVRAGHILTDSRRLNVAVTRARSKLVVVGDRAALARDYLPFRRISEFFAEAAIVTVDT